MTPEIISAVNEADRLREENKQLREKLQKTEKITKEEAKLLCMIQKCKIELKKQKLKKSGYNNHNKYHYFELDDFLPCVEIILDKHGLASFFLFEGDKAHLTICNSEGASHTWTTKCISSKPRENGYDVGVHMKSEQAVQTYARRTLWLQAMEITEPNEIESDEKPHTEEQKKKKVTADKVIKPIREEKTEEVTAERIKEILTTAQQKFDEAQQDKPEKQRRAWIWENARFIIKKHCRTQAEFNACKNSLTFQDADKIGK